MDKTGLWANLEGDRWVNDAATPLWGADFEGLTGRSQNMSQNFHALRFGAPCIVALPDGALFVAFWCYEECISVARWFKLRVE